MQRAIATVKELVSVVSASISTPAVTSWISK
jgi:hypothetical protein